MTPIISWSIALLPVLILIGLFIWLDVFKLMSRREVIVLLLAGAATAGAAYLLSGALLDRLPVASVSYSRFTPPWIEEGLKAVAVMILFRLNRIGFKIDAIISGFALGAGFALAENCIYLLRFPAFDPGLWLVRGLGTAVMHGTTSALLAAIAHELSERETRQAARDYDFRWWWFVPGLALAILIHSLFNQLAGQPVAAMIGTLVLAPIALMLILQRGTAEAQGWLVQEMAEHAAQLEALEAGQFPSGEASRRIQRFAERASPKARGTIIEYWRVMTSLVVAAESSLLQEAGAGTSGGGDPAPVLARLKALKAKLGPTLVAGLTPLLPFSRNDYWEVAQLQERLDGR